MAKKFNDPAINFNKLTEEESTAFVLDTIPLNKISVHEANDGLYGGKSDKEIEEVQKSIEVLAADIMLNGLLNPLTVIPHPIDVGRYKLIAGHRRYAACKFNNAIDVEAKILPTETAEDKLKADILLVTSNMSARARTPLQKANEIQYLKPLVQQAKELGLIDNVNKWLADTMDLSQRQVIRLSHVAEAAEEVKESVSKGEMTLTEAAKKTPKKKPKKEEPSQEEKEQKEKEKDYSKVAIKMYSMAAEIANAKADGIKIDTKIKGIVEDTVNKLNGLLT